MWPLQRPEPVGAAKGNRLCLKRRLSSGGLAALGVPSLVRDRLRLGISQAGAPTYAADSVEPLLSCGMSKPYFLAGSKSTRPKAAEAVDIAARYLIYKLYDPTVGRAEAWQALGGIGEQPEAVARAVERGWLIVRDDDVGRTKVRSGLLTDEGRRLGRRGLRR